MTDQEITRQLKKIDDGETVLAQAWNLHVLLATYKGNQAVVKTITESIAPLIPAMLEKDKEMGTRVWKYLRLANQGDEQVLKAMTATIKKSAADMHGRPTP